MKIYRYYAVSLIVIIIDQFSKFYIRHNMSPGETWKLTSKFFWITHVSNTGAAFSISLGGAAMNRIIFSAVTLMAAALLIYLISKSADFRERLAFSLILGGAVGNLIDRIAMGKVTDFVNWDFPDFIMERWPVFNVADSAVVTGVILLSFYYLFFDSKEHKEKHKDNLEA
jgi:signal peptidase II